MLSAVDNEFLCRTGPGAPMGDLLRRYWLPFLQSWELPEPDCTPVRVRLLSEDLIAFRETGGTVGLVQRNCPHRWADLFFGRNEEGGLRCTYHGWKFDTRGNCVDMPTETEESSYKSKIRIASYPVEEINGILWAYMGPPDLKPELPSFEFLRAPEDHLFTSYNLQESNFVQAVEGGIDSAHSNYLHSTLDAYHRTEAWRAEAEKSPMLRDRYHARDGHPKFFAQDTDYGVLIGARRDTGEDQHYWRYNLFLMPFYNMAPAHPSMKDCHAWVPIDDHSCMRWSFTWTTDRPMTAQEQEQRDKGFGIHPEMIPGTHLPTRNAGNDYLVDRWVQKYRTFTGIHGTGEQDFSVQEGMGPITSRPNEHLGTTDVGIIKMRQRLIRAARELQEGQEPPSAQDGSFYHVRAGDVLLPTDARWYEDAKGEAVRTATW